jgi:hypothetical protein
MKRDMFEELAKIGGGKGGFEYYPYYGDART